MHPLLLALVALAPAGFADSWLPPHTRTYAAPAGGFALEIEPGTCPERPRNGGAHGGAHARATLTRPDGGVVTYELDAFAVQPCDVRVLDGGDVLAADQYFQRGYGVVLARHDVTGAEVWRRTIEELLPPEARRRARTSTSSRHWLGRGAWREEARDGGRVLVLPLSFGDELEVDLATGASTWVEVEDHGDDAAAWVAKGESLLTGLVDDAVRAEALRCFERATEVDPAHVWAWYRVALWWQGEDVGRAREAVAAGLRHNPLRARENLHHDDTLQMPSPRVQLAALGARLATRDGAPEAGLAQAYAALASLPGLWAAQRERMRALVALGRPDEAWNQADDAHDGMLETWNGAPPSNQVRHLSASKVARALREDGLLEAALEHLERARGHEGSFEDTIERLTAELLEALGRTDEARAVVRHLLEHYEAQAARERGGRFDDLHARNVERTRAWLERLSDG